MGTPLGFLQGSAVPRLMAQKSEEHDGAQKPEQQRGAVDRGICFSLPSTPSSEIPSIFLHLPLLGL